MGQAHSTSPEFEVAKRQLTDQELQSAAHLFRSLAVQSPGSKGDFIIASVFQAYFNIHGSLGSRLFDIVSRERKDNQLLFEDLVIAKAKYEKGTPEDKEEFVHKLLDIAGDGRLCRETVDSAVTSCLMTVFGASAAEEDRSVHSFLSTAEFSQREGDGADAPAAGTPGDDDDDSKSGAGQSRCSMSRDDVKRWLQLLPTLHKFLSSLLLDPRTVSSIPGRQVPELIVADEDGAGLGGDLPLLRREFAWMLAGVMPEREAKEWRLVYSSPTHGASFNTFMGRFSAMPGPSLLLVRDSDGFVFGGYAAQPWRRNSEFYGDMKSFVFTLVPGVAIYRPSGANANIQWCAVNYQSEILTNGIGMGGQIDFFGFFLDASFDHGHSRPTLTFNSPQLSKEHDFRPDVIECWVVVLPEPELFGSEKKLANQRSGSASAKKGTVLERFKEDRAMMNFIGRANASDST